MSCECFLMSLLIPGRCNLVIDARCELITLPQTRTKTQSPTSHQIPPQPKTKPCKSCFPTFPSLTTILCCLRCKLHTIPEYDETALQKYTHRPGREICPDKSETAQTLSSPILGMQSQACSLLRPPEPLCPLHPGLQNPPACHYL